MIKIFLLSMLSVIFLLAHDINLQNSNFTLNQQMDDAQDGTTYNYNRLRLTASLNFDNLFFTTIGDIENYLGKEMIESSAYKQSAKIKADMPFTTKTKTKNYTEGEYFAKLYRLYGGYVDAQNRLSIGVQKVSMGVGRIWNPTDLFNPKNPLALEVDEVYGAFSVIYTYALGDLSEITAVVAQKKDHKYKYAARIKGYVDIADIALNIVSSDEATMIGYELEGELFSSGIALRSEAGWFDDKLLKKDFFQGIIGADYTFENSFSLSGEMLLSSHTYTLDAQDLLLSEMLSNYMNAKAYAGLNIGYELDALTYITLTTILNTDDNSFFASPSINYSLADDITLLAGAMLYGGKIGSEFGEVGNTYYLNFKVTF